MALLDLPNYRVIPDFPRNPWRFFFLGASWQASELINFGADAVNNGTTIFDILQFVFPAAAGTCRLNGNGICWIPSRKSPWWREIHHGHGHPWRHDLGVVRKPPCVKKEVTSSKIECTCPREDWKLPCNQLWWTFRGLAEIDPPPYL